MLRPALAAILLSVSCHAWSKPPTEGELRVAAARKQFNTEVRTAVEAMGVHYPPREVFVRVFKFESVLEIWARDKATEESTKRVPRINITKDGHYALVVDKPKSARAR